MQHEHKHGSPTLTLILSLTACICALGASQAYASESQLVSENGDSRVWVYKKTAVSERPPFIHADQTLPQLIVPLNTKVELSPDQTATDELIETDRLNWTRSDLEDFDLVEDNPLFIGAPKPSEYDRLEAQRESGAYPETLEVDPLYTVAGAGIETSF